MRTETKRLGVRRGQALMELAVGMFVIAFLLSATFYFVRYIADSLKAQNTLRSAWATSSDKIEVDHFAEQYIFGVKELKIQEPYYPSSSEITTGDLPSLP